MCAADSRSFDQLLTIDEVADLFQIPRSTIYAQRYRGTAPGSLGIRVGRHVRFRRADLFEWVEAVSGRRSASARRPDRTRR
jgi:excisionase family DNA binding protein